MSEVTEFDQFTPTDYNYSGFCGITYWLQMRGEVEVWRDAAGKVTNTFYSFFHRFSKFSGCKHSAVGYALKFLDNDVYGPTTETTDDGGTVEKTKLRIQLFFDDNCGICYNPGNVSIGTFTHIYNSSNGSGDDAQRLIALMKTWGGRLPSGSSFPIGDVFARRTLVEWYKLFGITDDWAKVTDPCGSTVQAECDSTP